MAAAVAPEAAAPEAGAPAFDPAISLPPLMAPITPLEVRLGKLRTTADAAAEPRDERQQGQQPAAPPPPLPALGLKLPPRALGLQSAAAAPAAAPPPPPPPPADEPAPAETPAPQESLPYQASDEEDPFDCWSSPVLMAQQTAPQPAPLHKHGSSSCGADGFGQPLAPAASAPVLCKQVSG